MWQHCLTHAYYVATALCGAAHNNARQLNHAYFGRHTQLSSSACMTVWHLFTRAARKNHAVRHVSSPDALHSLSTRAAKTMQLTQSKTCTKPAGGIPTEKGYSRLKQLRTRK